MKSIDKLNIAIIVSSFNRPITERMNEGAQQRLLERGLPSNQVNVFSVPGAVEIPLIAQTLAKKKKFDAIITLGAIIRGETSHYDYVCEQVSQGCQRVALDYDIPVIFGILTTENAAQAWDRLGGQHGHKGYDAADCALHMVQLLQEINAS